MSKIIIYTTPACQKGKEAEEMIKEKGIDYQIKDVSRDKDALLEMKEKSGKFHVPIIEIGEDVVVGFNKEKISKLIKYI